ncbi:hypothetical protein PORCRE_557 [Porphyromonas crevioricanis JCM 15906]|uniref:UPF0102 protein NCTC12858_00474 n=2 Tax=Porphyromonas crevioricanis TaxID=393921 RepID=A0A2X4PM93_9PORP|nr:YraN family protein [Porphyromonas crevioricanis]GAD04860.1 hypothetical protein PORCRE_557 [Porphyromonas crevioricanis JCM 15906]GAD07486.1 hypothetical protein PORCAN_1107 [Porphyromonas crevioricanis JCM 13913]SJZ95404.1 putative endonuclease [Porphyromonas crevioricanis]SQH72648.1 Uncharacterised protein family UPF0102 [Porphyromonas crevioricanis]
MARHNLLGERGEEAARNLLQAKGYRLLECNWVWSSKEIDIICQDHSYIVFVEVKTRTEGTAFSAHKAIDRQKIYNIVVAANHYIRTSGTSLRVRYDIVDVIAHTDGTLTLNHTEAAFHPPMMRQTYRALHHRSRNKNK